MWAGLVYYYECKKRSYRKLRINATKAHEQYKEILSNLQPSKRVIKLFQHLVFSEWDKVINHTSEVAEQLDKRIYEYKEEIKSIRKAVDEKIYSVSQGQEEADKLNREILLLQVERSELHIEQYNAEIISEFTNRFLYDLVLFWDNLDLPKRQAFVQKVFNSSIICGKDKIIRTDSLSPAFELISALASEDGENVTPLEFAVQSTLVLLHYRRQWRERTK